MTCTWAALTTIYSALGGCIHEEEVMSEKRFGEQWRGYTKKVRAFTNQFLGCTKIIAPIKNR